MMPESGSFGGPGGPTGGGLGGTPPTTSNLLPSSPLAGTSSDSAGVTGQSNTGPGISGQSLGLLVSGSKLIDVAGLDKPAGDGVLGEGNNGVHGVSAAANGVLGENSGKGAGVTGTSKSGIGVYGSSDSADGIYGLSMGNGVHGCSGQPTLPLGSGGPGIVPSNGAGVFGESYSNEGVFGWSEVQNGVHGVNGSGVGTKPGFGCGVWGESDNGYGIYGASNTGTGVYGINGSGSGTTPTFGCGVRGESDNGYGLYGASGTASGVYGTSGPGHWAGEFVGDHKITGNAEVGGNHTVKGNVTASDVMISGGADCAEEFDLNYAEGIDPGSVVVFDSQGALSTSDIPYNKRVAGVISGAGSYRPGMILDRRDSSGTRAPVALVGKVYCKVDASYGAVEVGDLLTTSSTHGFAMKAQDPLRSFGSVIGKALGRLEEGRGLIPILVAIG